MHLKRNHHNILFLLLGILFQATSFAQGVFNNPLNKPLQTVIEDYPNLFNNITGAEISRQEKTLQFESKVNIAGVPPAVIVKYLSPGATSISWQTALYETEDFHEAEKKFREYFNNIKNTIIRIKGMPPGILSAKYETPEEGRKFTSVSFKIIPGGSALDHLHIELNLQNQIIGWSISLQVYDDAD